MRTMEIAGLNALRQEKTPLQKAIRAKFSDRCCARRIAGSAP
jgi:hypothetical protein